MAARMVTPALALAVLACSGKPPATDGPCQPRLLPAGALAVVKPLVKLRIEQHRDEFGDGGRWKGASPRSPEVERRLEALLENRTPDGDVALAYLLGIYMGEHPGEEMVCEAVNRGVRMVPFLRAARDCRSATGLEPLPTILVLDDVLYDDALRELALGHRCEYED